MATEPTIAMLFNDRKGPELALEAIRRDHAFVEAETVETADEDGRRAWLLVLAAMSQHVLRTVFRAAPAR